MPILNLTPAETKRRRRFVTILVEAAAVFGAIFNFVLMRQIITTLSLRMVLAIVIATFLLIQVILFVTLHIMLGPAGKD